MAKTTASQKLKTPSDVRFLSKLEILDRTGLTFPTIWQMQQDDQFPRGREVGKRTMWIESEVNRWMNSRPRRLYKADKKADKTCG
jgi:predicted DNA-binding transcriptional regulator AlpA